MVRLSRCVALFTLVILASAGGAAAQQVTSSIMTVRVEGGQQTPVWFAWAVEENCEVRRGFNMRVDRLPKHGEATIERATRYVEHWWINRAPTPEMRKNISNCIGKPVLVLQLFYTPNPGYSGFDDLQLTVTTVNKSRLFQREVKLSVR